MQLDCKNVYMGIEAIGLGMKKGFMADALIMIISLFVIAIILVAVAYGVNQIQSTPNQDMNNALFQVKNSLLSWDTIAPFFIIGIGVALILTSFMVRSQPVLYAFMFILNIFVIFISIFLSNAWNSIFTGNALSSTAATFSSFTAIMVYLPIVSGLLSIIFAIAIFAKGD